MQNIFKKVAGQPVVKVTVNGVVGWLLVDKSSMKSYIDQNFFRSAGGRCDELKDSGATAYFYGNKESVAKSKYFKALIGERKINYPMWVIDFQGCFDYISDERHSFAGILGEDFLDEYGESVL